MTRPSLSDKDLRSFKENGFLYVKDYYDVDKDIIPLQRDIHRLIGSIFSARDASYQQPPFSPETFDAGVAQAVTADRPGVAILYDAIKRLPRFIGLCSDPRHRETTSFLLETEAPGYAPRGWGMRMDHPGEDKYLTPLHQDYVTQLCSPRGLVFWSPLRRVVPSLGPVVLYPGSHKEGILPVVDGGKGGYDLRVKNGKRLEERYPSVAPEVEVGDMVIIDYLLLHKSSPNVSENTRWAMICRYFDFDEPIGKSYGWRGGEQEGNSFAEVHGDLVG